MTVILRKKLIATAALLWWPLGGSASVAASGADFSVVAFVVNERAKKLRPYADLERGAVRVLGSRGSPKDIDCDAVTNKSGLLKCKVVSCNPKDSLTSTYVIGFKITQFHTQMNQTRVHVSKCVATPESSEAHILERVLVEKITSRDAMRLLGVEPGVMGFPVKQAPSSATVGRRLAAIYQETYGPYRVSAFRKQMQDLSAKAVSERRKDVAKLYQSYAVASANLVVRTILAEYLPQKQHGAIRITGRMGDLNSNIGYARREVAKYANSDESANLEILKKWPLPSDFVARTLARVQADVKKGDLKTTQFQQLEALLPKQPGKI